MTEAYNTSFHLGGETDIKVEHNLRLPKIIAKETDGHIDTSKSAENEIWINEDINDVYEDVFAEAIRDYNAKVIKSRHKERIIKDSKEYLKNCKNSPKLHYAREFIVQVGNFKSHPDNETCRAILKRFMEEFIARNGSNIRLYSCILHKDEGTYHLHCSVTFIGRGYEKGLAIRNSMSRALEQLGYGGNTSAHDSPQIRWEKAQLEMLDNIAKDEFGLNIIHPEIEEKKHMKIKDFREKARLKELEEKNRQLEEKNRRLEQQLAEMDERHTDLVDAIEALENYSVEKAEEILDDLRERMYDDRDL